MTSGQSNSIAIVTSGFAAITFLLGGHAKLHAQRVAAEAEARPKVEKAAQAEAQIKAQSSHGIAEGPLFQAPTDDAPDYAPVLETGILDGDRYSARLAGNPYTLAFAGGVHTPKAGVDPRVRGLRGTHFYGYVMLRGRMTAPAKLRILDTLGVRRLGVHTWQSWVAQIPLASVDTLAALPFVHWVGMAQAEQKIHPLLREELVELAPGAKLRVDISVFASDRGTATRLREIGSRISGTQQDVAPTTIEIPNGPMQAALERAGLRFEDYTDTGNVFIFRGRADAAAIRAIRDLNFVSAIEVALTYKGDGDQTQAMISQDKVRANYGGGSITAGVIDSGLWSPTLSQRHRDFSDKFMIAWDNVGNGAYNDEHGHGTGVAGVMVGSGTADARYRGGAPEVGRGATRRLFIGRLLDRNNSAVGSSATLFRAMSQDYTDSARRVSKKPRVINNSWGANPAVGRPWIGTESGSRRVDDYVFNEGQTYVFSSGNSAPSRATGSPAVAKNTLCVGSCWDNYDTTVRPGDLRPTSSGGTADGRRKPDVLAPGRWVCTTSRNSRTRYGNWWGTSFAAPHVTGAVASLIDHHRFLDYRPSQIKALFCAGAEWQGSAGLSNGYFGTRVGHGLVDASKTHGDDNTGWFSGSTRSDFTRSGHWGYWDITVPSNAQHLSLFVCWDEPAASASATKARVDDVRAYVDVYPFSSSANVGEYSITSSSSNVISKVGSAWATSLRGKRIRIKAYGHSIKSRARVGMCIMWMTKSPSVAPTVDVGVTRSIMKPSETFQMAGLLRAANNGHSFDNGVLRPFLPPSFTVTQLRRVGLDSVAQNYTGTNHPSFAFPSLDNGMTVGQGRRRDVLWTLRAPGTSGSYVIGARAWVDPDNRTLTALRTVCVDGLRPPKVSDLTSSSHFVNRWYNKTSATFVWSDTNDSGCAGTRGYAYRVAQAAATPTTINILGKSNSMKTVNLVSSTKGWYFNVRAVDFAGNLSASTASMGPVYIDTTKPVISDFRINNGDARTNRLLVGLRNTTTDSFSGPHQMRFSSDGSTWSAWIPYSAGPVTYNLNANGGNAQNGPKQVWFEVRDKAGNSTVRTDTIVFDNVPPVVTSVSINANAASTSRFDVSVRVQGVGIPRNMRFSSDGSTWSSWALYSEAAQSYDLRSYGGSTASGAKRVYCQMRDSVGNESVARFDSILYYPIPKIDTVSSSKVATVHDTQIVLSGKFADITRVFVDGKALPTKDPHAWLAGSWTKLSDTKIGVRMPQDVATGMQVLRIGNPAFLSPATGIQRTTPLRTSFFTQPTQAAGKQLDLVLHRGPFAANGLAVLSLSAAPLGLDIPGLISLQHGGNATTFIDPSFLTLPAAVFDASKGSLWVLPTLRTMKGVALFFQPLLFDPKDPLKAPISTAPMYKSRIE